MSAPPGLIKSANAGPIRKLLNMVMLLAIKDQASDIHFEPFEDEFKIRVRADGVLYEMVPPPRHLANARPSQQRKLSLYKAVVTRSAAGSAARARIGAIQTLLRGART